MSKPIKPKPTEYGEKLRAWKLRLVEWMGLDAESTLDIDYEIGDRGRVFVEWRAIARQEPRVGFVDQWAFRTDGESVEFSALAHLEHADGAPLQAEVGSRPEMFTPEERAQLEQLLGRRA